MEFDTAELYSLGEAKQVPGDVSDCCGRRDLDCGSMVWLNRQCPRTDIRPFRLLLMLGLGTILRAVFVRETLCSRCRDDVRS